MLQSVDARSRLSGRLPILSLVICVLQPVLDVLSYWQIQLGFPNYITLGLRIGMIALMVLLALPFQRRRKLLLFFVLGIILYLTAHVLTCLKVSSAYNLKEDLSEQARILMLPVSAYCFIVYIRENEKVFDGVKTGLMIDFGLILLIMILSAVTGTDPHTYAAKGIGICGWFFWTNAQSAILSLLSPLVIVWTIHKFSGKILPLVAACLLSFGALFAFGTRLAYAALAATGICLSVCLLISGRKRWPQALAVLLSAALFLALYPVSPMNRNRSAMSENAHIKQERIETAVAEARELYGAEDGGAGAPVDLRVLAAAYRFNLQGMVDRFGIDRVAEAYDYTLDYVRICDDRVRKQVFCRLLMDESINSAPLTRLFGMELGRTRVEETEVYVFETDQWEKQPEPSDPENDLLGVYYLCGIVGVGCLILFLGYFAWLSMKSLRKEPKKMFAPENAAYLIAFAICLVYAVSTVSVLRRNNASFYFAIVLACVWRLSWNRPSGETKKELIP
ncbi:MAG: O-antigen ligase family protein [Oscillospiraceae bacterium]|nr:O-antigen ligase family protein [Oscillospiraceae bacterium]